MSEMLAEKIRSDLKRSKGYRYYVTFMFLAGFGSVITLFVLDWKIGLCVFFMMLANNSVNN